MIPGSHVSTVRDITDVMDRLRPVLVRHAVDTSGFEAIYRGVGFRAPEHRRLDWRLLCEWLFETLPNPMLPSTPAWVVEVSDVVEGRR